MSGSCEVRSADTSAARAAVGGASMAGPEQQGEPSPENLTIGRRVQKEKIGIRIMLRSLLTKT